MKKIILIIVLLLSIESYSQINVLVHFTGNEKAMKTASDSLNFSYIKLQRMTDVYSLVIRSKEDFVKVRRRIKKSPNATIIGGWNKQGDFISFPNAGDNFTRAKYRQRLKRRITRNSEGDVIEDRQYTDDELKQDPLNQIYGWNKRKH